ncbi:MAG: heavy metal translocating P-type ATPase [Cyanobacteria bacterium J06632_3]
MTQLASPTPQPTQSNESSLQPTAVNTWVLDVEGMMCAGCVSTVEKKLTQCDGVLSATVNLVTEVAAVDCDANADPDNIAQILTQAGYPSTPRQAQQQSGLEAEADWLAKQNAAQQNQQAKLAIAVTLLIFSTLGHLQHLNITSNSLRSLLTLPIISTLWFHGILATLTLLFPARKILIEGFQGIRRNTPNMNTLVSLGALSAYVTSLIALIFPNLGWECFFDEPVMLLSFILLGRTLEQRARFQAASSLRSLISLQPAQARLIPAPKEHQGDNPSDAQFSENSDVNNGQGVKIPASQVQVGEWLRVLPGEKVPVDGIITAGQTTLDESLITGESMPIVKQTGDEIIAGTLNQSGAVNLKVSRTGADTTLGQMIRLIETAQTRKAPIQGLADVIAGYFTYGVLVCAAVTFCFWYFIGAPLWPDAAQSAMGHMHHGMHHKTMQAASHFAPIPPELAAEGLRQLTGSLRLLVSLKLTISVIVVACPCALGLATPTAILVGSGIGATQGLLIRGGDILEATHQLDTLVFDKTGTLTTGSPHVTDCLPLVPKVSTNHLLQIAATVESGTRHPLAVAIQQAADQAELPRLPATNFQTQVGLGVSALLSNARVSVGDRKQSASPETQQQPQQKEEHNQQPAKLVYLGNQTWMEKNGCALSTNDQAKAKALAQEGKTVVFIAEDSQVIGIIGVSDTLRPEATQTITKLEAMGIEAQILSGDRKEAATSIAAQLNIPAERVQAEVSPEDKVNAIIALQNSGRNVGLVGDGINDAPALAQADVGIALNSGTEVAMETADIVLMGDDLSDVLRAIALSQATFNKIRQNLAWAFTYNLICIPLAAGAFLPTFGLSLNPGFAGGLMALSSITVVLNSLLLRRQTSM